jgi:hypothetical protein
MRVGISSPEPVRYPGTVAVAFGGGCGGGVQDQGAERPAVARLP